MSLKTKPFCARRPAAGRELEITAPPYDVLTRADATDLAADRPDSILWVTRPEIAFSEDRLPEDADLYAAARHHYRGLVARGCLPVDLESNYYLYEQRMGEHCQRGIVALFHVDEYINGSIRRHETTRRDKERDRTLLLQAVGAQPGLVFLAGRETPALTTAVAAGPEGAWLADFKTPDGVRHRLGLMARAHAVAALESLPAAYIADGHHRAAAAAGVAAASSGGHAVASWFPAVLFPAQTLQVFAYHRCVRSLGAYEPAGFLRVLRERFEVTIADPAAPIVSGCIRLCLGTGFHDMRLRATPGASVSAAARLDVAVLQDQVLQPLLGIDDPRASPILDFIGGLEAPREIDRRLRAGEAAAAFMMAPVAVAQMMDVADAGESMPPKSTWFEPKLLEGLLIHDRENGCEERCSIRSSSAVSSC